MKKQKIYELIGRVVVFITLHAGAVAFCLWALSRMTVYKY